MISERMKNLVPYVPGEQPQDGQYIKLNTNENPYPPSTKVKHFLNNVEADKLRLYPDPSSTALRKAIANKESLQPENVFIGNGSDEVLSFVFYAFFDNSNGFVNFPEHTYSFYPVYSNFYNIPFKPIALNDDFSIDIKKYLRKDSAGIIIPNPNAPTGICLPLSSIKELLMKYTENRLVAIDEAYIEFGGESAASLIKDFDNLLVIRTFSKSSSLAGLRLGFALGNKKHIDALSMVKNSFNSYPVDYLAQKCGEIVVQDEEYSLSVINKIIQTRENFVKSISAKGWEILPSKANFVFVRKSGLSGRFIYETLKKKMILVRYFDKKGISDFVRITIGTDEEMTTLLSVMEKI